MSQLGKTLGRRIAEIRTKRGLGLNELARGLKVSKGYLSDIEKGNKIPTLIMLEKIAKALEAELRAFF